MEWERGETPRTHTHTHAQAHTHTILLHLHLCAPPALGHMLQAQRMDFLVKELKGKRPLLPPCMETTPDVQEVINTFR